MAHDVFISYSTKDKPIADAVCATLEGRGIRCWIAPRDILPGMDWGEAIIDAIEQSGVMVLVFSRNANASPQIKREVERAVNKNVTVIPLRIEDVRMSKSLEYFVSTPHWLDALNPPLERHLVQLADTLRVLLERMRAVWPPEQPSTPPRTPPPMPASAPAPVRERTNVATAPVGNSFRPPDAPASPGPHIAQASEALETEVAGETAGESLDEIASDNAAASASTVSAPQEIPPCPEPAASSAANDSKFGSTASIAGVSGARPPAVPAAPPSAPPAMPRPPPQVPSLGRPPAAGPFPFLTRWFGPISPNTQVAIAVGGALLLLMVLSCVLFIFIAALG